MANTHTQKEQLAFKIGLQLFFIIGSIIFTMLFTLPRLDEVGNLASAANATISNFEKLQKDGIPMAKLESTINRVGNNNELLDLVKKSPEETKVAIVKEGNEPYFKWLLNSRSKNEKDREILEKAKARINSIVPTISPRSGNINEHNITLRDYVTFIEQSLLKKFQIESLSPIGITNVVYEKSDEKNKKPTNPIGFFQLQLAFSSTNQNIRNFIDFIHSTGRPDILSPEASKREIPPAMSNPLITIESLNLEKILDPSLPNAQNTGQITLKFFVRGSSDADSLFLVESFIKDRNEFEKNLTTTLEACAKTTPACMNITRLNSLNARYQKFKNSFEETLNEKK